MPGSGGDTNTVLPLVLNVVATLFCCGSGLGPVLGIVGIVFALQAGNAKKLGDLDTARSKAKVSLILASASFVVGAIGTPLVYFGAKGF